MSVYDFGVGVGETDAPKRQRLDACVGGEGVVSLFFIHLQER
jgi:hypothetical protein